MTALFDRARAERAVWRAAKWPFFGRYARPWRWPEGVATTTWEAVTFSRQPGVLLRGLVARSARPIPRAIVVLCHPMATAAKGFLLRSGHARLLLDAGYDVLAFDFNGFGESAMGDFDYPADVVAAGRLAVQFGRGAPAALFGISMGAGYGICALSDEANPFRAAVFDSPFSTLPEFWRSHRTAHAALRLISAARPRLAARLSPLARMPHALGVERLALIYGEDDDQTPPSMGARLLESSTLPHDRKSLLVVARGRHCKAYEAAPAAYAGQVRKTFDEVFS